MLARCTLVNECFLYFSDFINSQSFLITHLTVLSNNAYLIIMSFRTMFWLIFTVSITTANIVDEKNYGACVFKIWYHVLIFTLSSMNHRLIRFAFWIGVKSSISLGFWIFQPKTLYDWIILMSKLKLNTKKMPKTLFSTSDGSSDTQGERYCDVLWHQGRNYHIGCCLKYIYCELNYFVYHSPGWHTPGFLWVSKMFMSFTSNNQKSLNTINNAVSQQHWWFQTFLYTLAAIRIQKEALESSSHRYIM